MAKAKPIVAFTNGTAILPDSLMDNATIICEEGRIVSVSQRKTLPRNAEVIDAKGGYISPGFVDLHVHGADDADFMDGTVEAARTVNRAHARHGTTSIFPTTATGTPAQVNAMLDACHELQQTWTPADGARVLGVHLYGPFFALEKVGCHRPDHRRNPTAKEFKNYFKSGIVKIATCAAELPGSAAFYKAAAKANCFITCGHSNSNWAEMQKAFDLGMRHVDHFWCAMSSVVSLRDRFGTPMQAGMEQFVLATDEMSTEVIADGYHLSPELLNFAYRMKGPEKLSLVTDANRAMDMPPGKYRFGNNKTGSWLLSDGNVGLAPNGKDLASSILGMDTMIRNMFKMTDATLPEAVRMGSLTPAERTGFGDEIGSLEKGKHADVVVLTKGLKVKSTYSESTKQ